MSVRPGPDEPLVVLVREDTGSSRRFVQLGGELDFATAAGLRRHLDTLMFGNISHLVVDLGDLTFCDLAGVRVLLRANRELRARGGDLTLLGPCPWVSRILTALDLTDQLRIELGASAGMDGMDGMDGAGSRR